MARLARLIVPHHAHIVSIRSLDGVMAFPDARSKHTYIDLLRTYCEKHGCTLLAYAVLDDRATMVMVPTTNAGIGKVMQSVGRFYVQHYNQHHERTGTLWEGRYRCAPVGFLDAVHQAMYAVECMPVHAGVVAHMRDYAFSSHQANQQGQFDAWVPKVNVWPESDASYLEFLNTANTVNTKDVLDRAYKGWVVGSEAYAKQVELLTGRRSSPKAKGGDRRSAQYRVSKGLPAKPSILKKKPKKYVRSQSKTHPVKPKNTAKTMIEKVTSDARSTQSIELPPSSDAKKTDAKKTAHSLPSVESTLPPQDSIVQSLASMEEKPKDGVGGTRAHTEPDDVNEPIQGSLF